MKRKRIQYNEINDEIYGQQDFNKVKIFIFCLILFFIGFLLNFNLQDRINALVKPILANNQSCPILYDKLEIEFLLPKVIFKNPIILGQCFGQYGQKLPIKQLSVALDGPSFIPPGLKFKISAHEGKTLIHIIPSLSFGKKVIEIRDTKIDATHLGILFNDGKSPFQGIIGLDGVFHLEMDKLSEGKLDVESKNIEMPEQNIKGFLAPHLKLKTLILKARVNQDSNLDIREFRLGNGNPVGINLKGRIFLNQDQISASQVNLEGTLQTTPSFLEAFALLKLLLPPDPNPNGSFRMKISGELGNLGQPQLSNP